MLKPGYKTTEFMVTLATALGAFSATLAGTLQPRYAAIVAAISVGAYAISRGLAKRPPHVVTNALPPTTTNVPR